jgi:hypothetical protein
MRTSSAMSEIRRIRDENSLRHQKMTSEELTKEFEESTKRFIRLLGRDVDIVSK